VFGADEVALHHLRFLLGEHHRSSCSVGEALVHAARLRR